MVITHFGWRFIGMPAGGAYLSGGDTTDIVPTLQYSLAAGASWHSTFDGEDTASYIWHGNSQACSNHGITCYEHVSTLTLSDYQSTGAIHVRATLTVRMTQCYNCTGDANGAYAWISVHDIRLIVDNCQIPTNETSASMGWNLIDPHTIHAF
jgi:hypothetical protein